MQGPNYTSRNIARAMGLGGFADDAPPAQARDDLRLLLTPSFHAEVCMSFIRGPACATVAVVVARSQIWRQAWPAPQPCGVHAARGEIEPAAYERLCAAFDAALPPMPGRVVVLDGMGVHTVRRALAGDPTALEKNVGADGRYAAFVAAAIQAAWDRIEDPVVGNALRDAGDYAGLRLPERDVPPVKPRLRMMVLGDERTSAALLAGLAAHHAQR